MPTAARLNAGFFVHAEDEVPVGQRFALPATLMEIQNRLRLLDELWIEGKRPAATGPRLVGVVDQPTPNRANDDVRDQATRNGRAPNLGAAETRQRQPRVTWNLASQRLDGDLHAGRKSPLDDCFGARRQDLPDAV